MSRYLVTGCAGFIGSTLVDALLAEGCEVVGVDAFTDYYPRDRKEAAHRDGGSHPAFELSSTIWVEAPLPDAALEGVEGSSTSPPARACARAGATDSSPTSTTTSWPRIGSPSPRRARAAARVRLLLVRLR